jgi:Domain of unknown function (DUF4912)
MATDDSSPNSGVSPRTGFRIGNGPVVPNFQGDHGLEADFGELPRFYGAPLLFAIARDPRTLFIYWNVDWSSIFAAGEPIDRQVYVRVKKEDGTDESQSPVEPMLGSYYATVAEPGGVYGVDLGYYDGSGGWNSVANSGAVPMPPESASENREVDLATVPFHISFQHLIDLFRASNGDALATILSRLQNRTVTAEERALLTPEEWELFRAMDLSIEDMDSGRRDFSDRQDEDLLRKRTEAILGFGATSPAHGFGESSWGSSPS